MKALNVAVRDTPVGLVAVLPPIPDGCYWDGVHSGVVLGVVTDCQYCSGQTCSDCRFRAMHDECGCECDRTGYAPLKFVKVLAVWPIVAEPLVEVAQPCVEVANGMVFIWQRNDRYRPDDPTSTPFVWTGLVKPDVPGRQSDLPDAEPGGVALHVEWTDCPTCGGVGVTRGKACPSCRYRHSKPCPTCQRPFVPPSDAPIVEVAA